MYTCHADSRKVHNINFIADCVNIKMKAEMLIIPVKFSIRGIIV